MKKLLYTYQDYDVEIVKLYNREDNSEAEFLVSDIMQNGHGRFVSATSFDTINRFFNGIDYQGNKIDYSKYDNGEGEIELTHAQLTELIYPQNNSSAKKGIFHLSNYYTNIYSLDYAKRSLAFGSSTFRFDIDNIRYTIKNGKPIGVKNFKITPLKDNYDYESSNVNQSINDKLKYVLSHNKNSKVDISFIDDTTYKNISLIQFNRIKKEHSDNVTTYSYRNYTYFAIRYAFAFVPNRISDFKLEESHEHLIPKNKVYNSFLSENNNKTPTNKFDISTTPILDKNSDNDAVSLSPALYALLNKDILNKHNDPFSVSMSHITTNGFRASNYNLSKGIFDNDNKSVLNEEFSFIKDPKLLNKVKGFGYSRLSVDPLILDLNGDGARAVSYNEKSVLFDIDNDGGSLEETGWLSNQDGLLVRDLNNNGKIDNMSEVFSEYYAGKAGRNGEAGEKPFANGFEALKSLDSNKDNVFDSKDRDFNVVRVWQDKNHNSVTDTGELKTLSSLKITTIDLVYQEAGSQLFFSNELLAKGYLVHNCKKHLKINRL